MRCPACGSVMRGKTCPDCGGADTSTGQCAATRDLSPTCRKPTVPGSRFCTVHGFIERTPEPLVDGNAPEDWFVRCAVRRWHPNGPSIDKLVLEEFHKIGGTPTHSDYPRLNQFLNRSQP